MNVLKLHDFSTNCVTLFHTLETFYLSSFFFKFYIKCTVTDDITRVIGTSSKGFFDRARSEYEHNTILKSVNMQNKHGGSIRSHDCYLKKTVKNSLIQYSFYVMDSRVSSNCTRNIHRLATPEKEVNRKENTVGKISKLAGDRFVKAYLHGTTLSHATKSYRVNRP